MSRFKKFTDSFKIFRQSKTLRRKLFSNFKKLAETAKEGLRPSLAVCA
ncbi:hypothetical protein [Sulfitobacter pontiacus]